MAQQLTLPLTWLALFPPRGCGLPCLEGGQSRMGISGKWEHTRTCGHHKITEEPWLSLRPGCRPHGQWLLKYSGTLSLFSHLSVHHPHPHNSPDLLFLLLLKKVLKTHRSDHFKRTVYYRSTWLDVISSLCLLWSWTYCPPVAPNGDTSFLLTWQWQDLRSPPPLSHFRSGCPLFLKTQFALLLWLIFLPNLFYFFLVFYVCAWYLKRPEDSDPQELQMAVNHYVGAGNETRVLSKSMESS